MHGLTIDRVSHWFGSTQALADVSLDARKAELIALLGPSGCGKTTLLRMIAGFLPTRQGRIVLNGRDITHEPAYRRNTGMVFQSYALFPHMSVDENVAFGLKMRGLRAEEQRRRTADTLQLVRLEGMGSRYPRQLSGGQQQRVAIARALVIRPDAFLLDEPLSNLDAKLRYSVGLEIRALQQSLGLTTVFVTHDQTEALALADRLVVMDHGRVVQIGTASELYSRPASIFVANFLGRANLLPGRIVSHDAFRSDSGVRIACDTRSLAAGSAAMLCLRPEQIALGRGPEGCNTLAGMVRTRTYLGGITEVVAEASGSTQTLIVHHQNRDGAEPVPEPGQSCSLWWRPESCLLLEPSSPVADASEGDLSHVHGQRE